MNPSPQIALKVAGVEPLGPSLKRFVLTDPDGRSLPPSAAGSHLVMTLKGPERTWKNAYSVTTPVEERGRYEIIVRRVEHSRGGSHFMHDTVKAGDVLQAAIPHNLFPLTTLARKHVLIGGGIGVTPLLAQAAALQATGARYELHQICAPDEVELFRSLLSRFKGAEVHVYGGRTGCDIAAILARQPLGSHVYTCGPTALMEAVTDTAKHLGWPGGAVHHESFGSHAGGAPFTAVLSRSGLEVQVGEDESLLEAVEAAGVDAPYMCRGGACGQCQTRVVEGEAEHRDDFLTEEERASGESIMICVSRAKTPRLVLDL